MSNQDQDEQKAKPEIRERRDGESIADYLKDVTKDQPPLSNRSKFILTFVVGGIPFAIVLFLLVKCQLGQMSKDKVEEGYIRESNRPHVLSKFYWEDPTKSDAEKVLLEEEINVYPNSEICWKMASDAIKKMKLKNKSLDDAFFYECNLK